MLRHLGYPEAAADVERAVREVIAEGRTATTYDLGGPAGTSQFADAVIARLADHRDRRVTSWPASLRTGRPPRKPVGTAPQGFGRTARRDAWWTSPLGVGFWLAVLVLYSVFSALVWTPGLRRAERGRRLPVAVLLPAVPGPRPAARHLAGDPDPVDPDRLPGHLLLLPARLLPDLPGRSARLRGGGAAHPSALPDGGGAARSSSRTSTASSCTSRSSSWRSTGSRSWSSFAGPGGPRLGLGSVILLVDIIAPERATCSVPLDAPPRGRAARLLLVHALEPDAPLHLAAPERPECAPHGVRVGQPASPSWSRTCTSTPSVSG